MALKNLSKADCLRFAFRCGFLVFVLLFGAIFAFPQETQPTPPPIVEDDDKEPVRIQTDLVTLTLTVTDIYGRYVSGLTKDAFTVFDDGNEQEITFFSDSDAPVSIGILFDVSGSMSGDKIGKARKALERFINTSHPNDEYFLIAFNSRAQLLLDRTRDGEAVLRKLTWVEPRKNTALYDAVSFALDEFKKGKFRKKVLIVVTDGEDNESRLSFRKMIERAEEEEVIIYTVGMSESDMRFGKNMQGELEKLAEVTGGKAHFPQNTDDCRRVMDEIALEVSRQYSLGYYPVNDIYDGKWRNIRLQVKAEKSPVAGPGSTCRPVILQAAEVSTSPAVDVVGCAAGASVTGRRCSSIGTTVGRLRGAPSVGRSGWSGLRA